MDYNYLYCTKDGFYQFKTKDGFYQFKTMSTTNTFTKKGRCFTKKGRCYKVFFNEYEKKIPEYFIDEEKKYHLFGAEEKQSTQVFFKEFFRTPNFKHLMIEKKM